MGRGLWHAGDMQRVRRMGQHQPGLRHRPLRQRHYYLFGTVVQRIAGDSSLLYAAESNSQLFAPALHAPGDVSGAAAAVVHHHPVSGTANEHGDAPAAGLEHNLRLWEQHK